MYLKSTQKKRKLEDKEWENLKKIYCTSGDLIRSGIKSIDGTEVLSFVDGLGDGQVFNISILSQGTAFYNRVGAKINYKKLTFRWRMLKNPFLEVEEDPVIRPWTGKIALVYDRQPRDDSNEPDFDEIYIGRTYTGAVIAGESDLFPNPVNTKRFLILKEHNIFVKDVNAYPWVGTITGTLVANPNSNFTGVIDTQILNDTWDIDMNDLVAQFPVNLTHASTGRIYVVMISDDILPLTPAYSLKFTYRLQFEDN